MFNETLTKIEARIRGARAIKDENRDELLSLVSTLRDEVGELAKSSAEQAESITSFTELSTREATREQRDPQLLDLSLQGLSSSVREFESSHPHLVKIVNSICHSLSNLGI